MYPTIQIVVAKPNPKTLSDFWN